MHAWLAKYEAGGLLAVLVAAILFGATGVGIWFGRALTRRNSGLKEPLGTMQAALVDLAALLLAE